MSCIPHNSLVDTYHTLMDVVATPVPVQDLTPGTVLRTDGKLRKVKKVARLRTSGLWNLYRLFGLSADGEQTVWMQGEWKAIRFVTSPVLQQCPYLYTIFVDHVENVGVYVDGVVCAAPGLPAEVPKFIPHQGVIPENLPSQGVLGSVRLKLRGV